MDDSKAQAPTAPAFDRRDFLWKALVRYDVYVGTTISRAAAVTALNALVVGGIIIKASDVLGALSTCPRLRWVAIGALALAGVASLVSTAFSFVALVPYLGKEPGGGSSLIFFAHVGARSREDHEKLAKSLDGDAAHADLANQTHDMAVGLMRKFRLLNVAARATVLGLLPALAVLGLVVLVATIIQEVSR